MKTYLAKFRQGNDPIEMNAVDFYREGGKLIRHDWAMGGESKKEVHIVPTYLPEYKRIALSQGFKEGEMKDRDEFLVKFRALLKEYNAELTADDHWEGYAECGQDIRMVVEFDDYNLKDIDMGKWMDHNKELN